MAEINVGQAFNAGFNGGVKKEDEDDDYLNSPELKYDGASSLYPSISKGIDAAGGGNSAAGSFAKAYMSEAGKRKPIGAISGNTQEETMSRGKEIGRSTQSYEGWRSEIYKDTEGYDTIGFGHKLTDDDKATGRYKNGITKEQGQELYLKDHKTLVDRMYKDYPWVKDAPESVRTAVEDMSFNMGPAWLKKFPNTRKALEEGNYEKAGSGVKNSKYYRQVGQRAKDNVSRIRSAMDYDSGQLAEEESMDKIYAKALTDDTLTEEEIEIADSTPGFWEKVNKHYQNV